MPALNAPRTRESTSLLFYERADADGPKAVLDYLIADSYPTPQADSAG